MRVDSLPIILTLVALGACENNVEADDVPQACRSVDACLNIFELSRTCDESTSNSDGYNDCVCGSTIAQSTLTDCADCVARNVQQIEDRTDNDVTDLMSDCGWTYTGTILSSGSATMRATTSAATTASTTLLSQSVASTIVTITSSDTTFVSTQTSVVGASATTGSSSEAKAPMVTAAAGSFLFGMALALPALL
ncbi:uncharacterized protein BCR38DRAFT_415794 [Pseudomassariella vexata]|uniref:Extracellular membrane protein CFEM domain-containing protein n=1 Tax=Pseudomassariella vexata TaxID=1141098 RepID=A0A1Y2EHK4_9PEZI|nr:uncharacterized protein BCR38DRAFT_415794 [Pseudomassariella vexata]ORY71050.1 hypothetical protein BCR38DRAFT_415794 [Pseudomassariella vexata]